MTSPFLLEKALSTAEAYIREYVVPSLSFETKLSYRQQVLAALITFRDCWWSCVGGGPGEPAAYERWRAARYRRAQQLQILTHDRNFLPQKVVGEILEACGVQPLASKPPAKEVQKVIREVLRPCRRRA